MLQAYPILDMLLAILILGLTYFRPIFGITAILLIFLKNLFPPLFQNKWRETEKQLEQTQENIIWAFLSPTYFVD